MGLNFGEDRQSCPLSNPLNFTEFQQQICEPSFRLSVNSNTSDKVNYSAR
jgi:hypothetical protein